MRLILESKDSISVTKLPNTIEGNYWVLNNNNNLINVETNDNKWVLKSNTDIKISNSLNIDKLSNVNYIDSVILEDNKFYYIVDIVKKDTYILYTVPSYENFDNFIVDYNQNNNIIIGKAKNSDIIINNDIFNDKEISIEYDKKVGNMVLTNLSKSNVFVNYNIINDKYNLANGDIIFIKGIFIYYFGALLLVNNNNNDLENILKENMGIDSFCTKEDLVNEFIKEMNYDYNKTPNL